MKASHLVLWTLVACLGRLASSVCNRDMVVRLREFDINLPPEEPPLSPNHEIKLFLNEQQVIPSSATDTNCIVVTAEGFCLMQADTLHPIAGAADLSIGQERLQFRVEEWDPPSDVAVVRSGSVNLQTLLPDCDQQEVYMAKNDTTFRQCVIGLHVYCLFPFTPLNNSYGVHLDAIPGPSIEEGKKRRRRRELLTTASPVEADDDAFAKHLEACGTSDYKVELYVDPDTHLYAIGYPDGATSTAECPTVATHVVLATKSEPVHKEVLLWEDNQQGLSLFEKEGRLTIGTFKLADLARAYQAAEPDATGGGVYDVVTNNCGGYLMNLASELGVKVDSRVTSFVARRLLEHSGKQLADSIRNSAGYLSLFGDRHLRVTEDTATDKELVELLVHKSVSKA